MPKNKIPRPPDGWQIVSETTVQECRINIVSPHPDNGFDPFTIDEAREFAQAIIRECDHLEGKN